MVKAIAEKCVGDTCRQRHLPSNCIIMKIVLRELGLFFKDQNFLIFISLKR